MNTKSTSKSLAILSYHKIGRSPENWESWFYIPEETFVDHLNFIQNEGWKVIDLSTFLLGLRNPECLPERAILLTFDDGYRSLCEIALPWLRQYAFLAIVFMPTDYIGGQNDFDHGMEPDEAMCDWDHLRELERGGVSIQSHGASHSRFSTLSQRQQKEELLQSKKVLENNLGNSVEVIAFPYGDCGNNPKEMKGMLERVGYRAACLYGGGPIHLPKFDPFRLERVAMGPDTNLKTTLHSSGMNSSNH